MQNANWRTRRPPFVHFSNYSTPTFVGYTEAELKFARNPAINVAADCLAAPRRNFEADSAAPWQRAQPLDHVQVAAVPRPKNKKCISLLNSSNINRINAKETVAVVAKMDKEETVAGTSLRFSTDVVGSSSST